MTKLLIISLFLCGFHTFLWLKNPCNPCNPWLIKDLRACKVLYICRETFTDVMSPLQIRPFMQNEPNFRKSQMNVNKVLTKDYEIMDTWWSGKNEPKTNPNEPNFKKAKMYVTSIITKGYENKSPIRAPKKRSQISKRQKPMQTSLSTWVMKKTAISGSDKTNPNKANFKGGIYSLTGLSKKWNVSHSSSDLYYRIMQKSRAQIYDELLVLKCQQGTLFSWHLPERPLPAQQATAKVYSYLA